MGSSDQCALDQLCEHASCSTTLKELGNNTVTVWCPEHCKRTSFKVFGKNVFNMKSSACRAAIYSGAINDQGEKRWFDIKRIHQFTSFEGCKENEIKAEGGSCYDCIVIKEKNTLTVEIRPTNGTIQASSSTNTISLSDQQQSTKTTETQVSDITTKPTQSTDAVNITEVIKRPPGFNATEVINTTTGFNATEVINTTPGFNATEVINTPPSANATEVINTTPSANATEVINTTPSANATQVIKTTPSANATQETDISGSTFPALLDAISSLTWYKVMLIVIVILVLVLVAVAVYLIWRKLKKEKNEQQADKDGKEPENDKLIDKEPENDILMTSV